MFRSARLVLTACTAFLLSIVRIAYWLALAAIAAAKQVTPVAFTADGKVRRPEGYRKWVYIGTPLTPTKGLDRRRVSRVVAHFFQNGGSDMVGSNRKRMIADPFARQVVVSAMRASPSCSHVSGGQPPWCFAEYGQPCEVRLHVKLTYPKCGRDAQIDCY